MNIKLNEHQTSTVTTDTFQFEVNDQFITYIEYLNDKGKIIDCNLRDVDGDEIDNSLLLEEIQNFVDSMQK